VHRTRRAPQGGFTLIEVLVVFALLALVAGSMVRGIQAMSKSDLKSESSHLAGAMRYMFDRASTTGKVHRLVFDIEAGKYWAEVSDDKYFLPRDKETSESRLEDWKRVQKEAEARAKGEPVPGDEVKPQGGGLGFGFGSSGNSNSYDVEKYLPKPFEKKRSRFKAFKETGLKPVALKKVKLAGVFTPRMAAPVLEGQTYVYFFPLGFAEAAIVYLQDESQETTFSLVVHPLTGRVIVFNHKVEAPIDKQFDDAGELVNQ